MASFTACSWPGGATGVDGDVSFGAAWPAGGLEEVGGKEVGP